MANILRAVPGFRSGAPWKKIVVSIYYIYGCLGVFTNPYLALFYISAPFVVFGFMDLILHKKKGIPLIKAVIPLALALVLMSCSASNIEPSSDGGQNKANSNVENSIDKQPTAAPSVELVDDEDSIHPSDESVDEIIVRPSNDPNDGGSEETQPTQSPGEAGAAPSDNDNKVDGKIYVHFIDVGQADSIFVKTPSFNLLIDGGDRGDIVANYLKNLGISELDLVIGTHPHADHIGGLTNVFEKIKVKEVMDPAVVHTSKTFEDYLTLIDEKDIKFTETKAGMSRSLGDGISLEILAPSSVSDQNLNNVSIVSRLVFGNISFLFAGDAETKVLNQLAKVNIKSDVLKVSHHGSSTGMSQSFIKVVSPKAAVISSGAGNSYGHPHNEALEILAGAGVDIYRTDLQGSVIIESDGQVIDVNIKQPYQYVPAKVPEETPKPTPEPTVKPAPEPTIAPTATPIPTEKPAEPISKQNFVGSKESDKYHKPDCRYVKNILPQNEIWFGTIEEAQKVGYKACGVCKPN